MAGVEHRARRNRVLVALIVFGAVMNVAATAVVDHFMPGAPAVVSGVVVGITGMLLAAYLYDRAIEKR